MLEECPFCRKRKAEIKTDEEVFYVICGCGAEGPPAETERDAKYLWNRWKSSRGKNA